MIHQHAVEILEACSAYVRIGAKARAHDGKSSFIPENNNSRTNAHIISIMTNTPGGTEQPDSLVLGNKSEEPAMLMAGPVVTASLGVFYWAL